MVKVFISSSLALMTCDLEGQVLLGPLFKTLTGTVLGCCAMHNSKVRKRTDTAKMQLQSVIFAIIILLYGSLFRCVAIDLYKML